MTPEQIAELLQKSVKSALNKESAPTPAPAADGTGQAVADLAKAVSAINEKIDTLSKVAVTKEPETVDTKIDSLASIVKDLTSTVTKIAAGEKVEPKDEMLDLSKISKADFKDLLKDMVGAQESTPEGEGKEDLATILKSIVAGKEDENLDIDLDAVEVEDVAGNKLSKKARDSRQDLDAWFGKKLNGSVERHLGVEDEDSDDDE